jgi:hypothetical protein
VVGQDGDPGAAPVDGGGLVIRIAITQAAFEAIA